MNYIKKFESNTQNKKSRRFIYAYMLKDILLSSEIEFKIEFDSTEFDLEELSSDERDDIINLDLEIEELPDNLKLSSDFKLSYHPKVSPSSIAYGELKDLLDDINKISTSLIMKLESIDNNLTLRSFEVNPNYDEVKFTFSFY